MQGKQTEPTEWMKNWVKSFNDQKFINFVSPILGVNPLTIFKVPFFDCHWFDFNSIQNEIKEQTNQQKHTPITNINSTFRIPYLHNIFLFGNTCCYVSPTENGLDVQLLRPLNSDRDFRFVSFSLYVDDVPHDIQSKVSRGAVNHIVGSTGDQFGWGWRTEGSNLSCGAIDYSQAYRIDIENVMGTTLSDIRDWKRIHSGSIKKLKTQYETKFLSASSHMLLLLEKGKYKEKFLLAEETIRKIKTSGLPEDAQRAFIARANDLFSEITSLLNHVYHALNLIHKHNIQTPVFTTTKDSVFKSKRRNRRGVKPLIEWHTYEYDISKPVFKLNKNTGYRGTHASPREHERRGHYRTMKKSGKQVWVKPSKVGNKSLGEIHKNFVVTSTSSIGQSQER